MLKAIDIHAHYGNPDCFPQKGVEKECLRLSLETLEREYGRQHIVAACLSPMEGIFPADENMLLTANSLTEQLSQEYDWFYQWVVVDPLFPASYRQAERMLKNRKCVGVKIHPDAQGYPIETYGEEIFAFCAEQGAVLETHSGEKLSLPERLVPLADRYPQVTVIAAHLGCGFDGCVEHQVNAVKAAQHGNLYTDVSSARSILPNLLEWGAGQVGAGKLLFGTDTPLHHIAMMKQRVECADLAAEEIENILYGNANQILNGVFEG